LRRLALELSQTEDREHRRLATNLHDRIGQSLNVSLMKLGALRASASGTQFAGPLEEIHRLLDQAVDDTQSLVVELSPPVLYELGLEAALEWLAEQMQEQHGLRVEVRTQGSAGPLDPDMRGILFRMVRELLFNVVKHARAQTAEVHVCWEDEVMHIEVADDGIGFNTDGLSSSLGRSDKFGLFSIRERLDSIGGQLHINSQPGRGTQVALTAPQKRTAGKNGKRLQVPS
jgi:signal transduction histidine kinase